MKKKKIKIKHHKYSLYQRKKSTGRKVLTVIIMVVIVAALVVVGYGVGKPLMEYFSGKNTNSEPSSAWTPPASAETSGASAETSQTSTETTEPTKEEQTENKTVNAFILPEAAVLSSDALNSALAAAKNGGYTDIAVTLKDETGNFLYKTSVKDVSEEQITGTLTAKQIADLITAAGFTPRARINTLLDRTTQTYAGKNICYMITDGGIWHDYYVDRGGKSWLDPFNAVTAKYLAAITGEISQAGFSSIILANTRYPAFNNQDYTNFLRDLAIADDSARLNALWNVADACVSAAKSGNSSVLLEVSDEELLSDSVALTSAEPVGDKTKLKTVTLLVDYAPGEKAGYNEARAFIGRLSAMYSGQDIAVRLTASSFSSSALDQVKKAFADADITVYSE